MELVAAERIPAGTRIAVYLGEYTARSDDVYTMEINTGEQQFLITAARKGTIARFANTADDVTEANARRECWCVYFWMTLWV